MTVTTQQKKETGATFTPVLLANYLAEKLLSYLEINGQKINILDPACGEGALLSAISKQLVNGKIDFNLIGYDSNEAYLLDAAKELNGGTNVSLNNADFLEAVHIKSPQTSLFDQPGSEHTINKSIDLIIANPPYVRTQILGAEKAQFLAKKFNLKGRVDLYYPFLIAMTHALKEGGLLGVITSNRYLFTKSGSSIRHFLFSNYEILEVIDLGDTKLFDAAVLPAIFIG